VGPRYCGRPPITRSKKVFNFCEDSFKKIKDCDIDPIIFLRFAKPLKDINTEIPFIDPVSFYPIYEKGLIEFEVKPDYKSEVCLELIEMGQKPKYEERKKIMQ
jgi:hypothetical protein